VGEFFHILLHVRYKVYLLKASMADTLAFVLLIKFLRNSKFSEFFFSDLSLYLCIYFCSGNGPTLDILGMEMLEDYYPLFRCRLYNFA